jgi:hypothetical protein
MTVRDLLAKDKTLTCFKFGLSAGQAEYFETLSPSHLWNFVISYGDNPAFEIRADLVTRIEQPTPLIAILAALNPARH